jgi:hypothetical protein
MNATQASEIPRISAAWYRFPRPSIARRITSYTSIVRSTAEVRISSKSAFHSNRKEPPIPIANPSGVLMLAQIRDVIYTCVLTNMAKTYQQELLDSEQRM